MASPTSPSGADVPPVLPSIPLSPEPLRRADDKSIGAVTYCLMLDHDGGGIAGAARELAFLDAQGGRPQGFAGSRADRNARLFVRRPAQ